LEQWQGCSAALVAGLRHRRQGRFEKVLYDAWVDYSEAEVLLRMRWVLVWREVLRASGRPWRQERELEGRCSNLGHRLLARAWEAHSEELSSRRRSRRTTTPMRDGSLLPRCGPEKRR